MDKLAMIRRGLRKPPKVLLERIISELNAEAERFTAPRRARNFLENNLLEATETHSLNELWNILSNRPYPLVIQFPVSHNMPAELDKEKERVLALAERSIKHEINLLGTGDICLGKEIDWHKDYKTGKSWIPTYFRSIEYTNLDKPSDVKIPWEISRMQWLIPVGQAYLLTKEERYAETVKSILLHWISNNPYAQSVNWVCTMEVALRIITWTWFFKVFCNSEAWKDQSFRAKFLCCLFLHGDFTFRHPEKSDINGNHYTANAAGLMFAGLFFGKGQLPLKWRQLGWDILRNELPRQIYPDGVDFEASVPYHRLVLELFLYPALYKEICGEKVEDEYKNRIVNMVNFTIAYSRNNGTVPLWGDADDARVLPFGDQHINDHRYLIGLVGLTWGGGSVLKFFSGSLSEIFWTFGATGVDNLRNQCKTIKQNYRSRAFPQGGFYIMRNQQDHVFIDCGSVGLGGRGGHGHNDCLAFEASLNGVELISDCGAYLYTANYQERNLFRSTAYHNTPQIDDEEINRFIRPDYLWNLHNDAQPECLLWKTKREFDVFQGTHSGYARLKNPLKPIRTIVLHHPSHAIIIRDEFIGMGHHSFRVPIHLHPGVEITDFQDEFILLEASGKKFILAWNSSGSWNTEIITARVSPSYGVVVPSLCVQWFRKGTVDIPLGVCLMPQDYSIMSPHNLLRKIWEEVL